MYADLAVSIVIYLVFLTGMIFLQMDNLSLLVRRFRLRRRLSVREEKTKFSQKCTDLLTAATGKKIDGIWLIVFTVLIFASVFALSFRLFILPLSLVFAVMAASMPVIFLFSELEKRRSRGSREGIALLSVLYREYRIHNLNMTEAIEVAVADEGSYPVCRRQLYLLLLRLRESLGRANIEEACNSFSFALGTVWGKMLAGCIRASAADGTDVSAALEDISNQLKLAKRLDEERKRMNSESVRMTLFLVPLIYAGSILLSHKFLGLSFSRILHNQFFTPEGILLFMFSVFLFLLNLLVLNLLSGTRVDY